MKFKLKALCQLADRVVLQNGNTGEFIHVKGTLYDSDQVSFEDENEDLYTFRDDDVFLYDGAVTAWNIVDDDDGERDDREWIIHLYYELPLAAEYVATKLVSNKLKGI